MTNKTPHQKGAYPELQLLVLQTVSDVIQSGDDWRALEQRNDDKFSYFQSYDWCCTWLRKISTEENGPMPYVITIRKAGQLIAVFPLMCVHKAGGVRVLKSLTQPHSQYTTMMVDTVLYDQASALMVADHFNTIKDFDVLFLDVIPENSPLIEVIKLAGKEPELNNESSTFDLNKFADTDAFDATISRTRRKGHRRRRKGLTRDIGPVRFEVVWPGEPDFTELVDSCVTMKAQWLNETDRVSRGFSYSAYGDFLANLTGSREELEGMVAFALYAGDKLLAVDLVFIRHRHLYDYISAFEWDLRRFSPGKIHLLEMLHWAIENHIEGFDLLGNTTSHKEYWSNQSTLLYTQTICYSLKGVLYSRLWLQNLRPVTKQLYLAMPSGLRRIIKNIV